MFGWLNRNKFPKQKLYLFEYHHQFLGDGLRYNTVQYCWLDAVNSLLSKEVSKSIYIDKVEVKDIKE